MSPILLAARTLLIAAMVCSLLLNLMAKTSCAPVLKLLCGLFLTVTLLQSLAGIDMGNLFGDILPDSLAEGEAVAALGQEISRQQLAQRIKEEAEEYILDKANALGASVSVEILVSGDDLPVPEGVILSGRLDSSTKETLEAILSTQLGISKERQQWNLQNIAND